MFDLSWSHILIFLVVALVVVGPKDMPKMLRVAGQWVGKARGMANEFRKSFDDMARQSELDELRKEIENLRHEHPLTDLEKDVRSPVMTPLTRSVSPLPPGPALTAPATPSMDTPEALLQSTEPSEPIPDGAAPPPP